MSGRLDINLKISDFNRFYQSSLKNTLKSLSLNMENVLVLLSMKSDILKDQEQFLLVRNLQIKASSDLNIDFERDLQKIIDVS
jgi:hypothetical protein